MLNTQFYTVSVRTFVIPFYYGSGTVPSKRVMSSPLEHKTIFFSEFRLGDLMLYVATKFN
jgi:hypothetical protein